MNQSDLETLIDLVLTKTEKTTASNHQNYFRFLAKIASVETINKLPNVHPKIIHECLKVNSNIGI